MEKLTFTNANGESITFEKKAPFLLQRIEGTGATEIEDQSQKAPYQDGETPIDSSLDPRFIPIQFALLGSDEKDVYRKRRTIQRVCNPKLGEGVLKHEHPGGINEIKTKIDSGPTFPAGKDNRGIQFQTGLLTFKCHSPFWLDSFDTSEPLEAWIGLFKFPLTFPMKFGRKGESKILQNDGDVSTPVMIEFTGPATNPQITNKTTNEFIKVNRSLLTGETLVINTAFGNKRVDIMNGDGTSTNVFNWIDVNSTFFSLIPGENEIEYTADSGADSAAVKLTYRNRYVGI